MLLRLHLISPETKHLVHRWLLIIQQSLPFEENIYYIYIPQLVIQTCLLFYAEECFGIHGKAIELDDTKYIATAKGNWSSIYGSFIIPNDKPYIYEWELQVIQHEYRDLVIGLESTDEPEPEILNDDFTDRRSAEITYFAYCSNGGLYTSKGVEKMDHKHPSGPCILGSKYRYSKGDTIVIKLDHGDKTVEFYKDGYCRNIGCKNITLKNYTRLSVTLVGAGNCIKLCSFSCRAK